MKTSHPDPHEAANYWEKTNKAKYPTWNCIRLKYVKRRPACQTMSKASNISSAPDLLKALAIPSDATVTRSLVDREDLKGPENQIKGHIFLGDQNSYYL